MSADFLPFARPEIGENEISEVIDSLRSGWITTGPKVHKFERAFSSFLGGGVEAVAVSSATAGLHLALEALNIGPGDEVITTTHTFTATAEVIRYLGADPVLVDITADSLCMNPSMLESVINSKTRAIIPVHFGGRAAEMDEIFSLASMHDLYVVEDAAHALPATSNNLLIGNLDSDATVFSFYANKTMTTGEGGMLVTRNPEIARRARVMRLHGISRDAFDRYTSISPGWFYEVVAPGFKYNMTDIEAALGIHQLSNILIFHEKRARIAGLYDEAFSDLPIILPPKPLAGEIHAWHLYVIQLGPDVSINRNEFINRMYEQGVGCSVHYIPLHLHPYWRDTYDLSPDMFPVSQSVYESSVSLPIYSKMSDEDVNRVISAVKAIITY